MRCTEDGDTPDAFAMPRVLQCVAPSGFVSSVRATISSMRSSPILRGAPHLGSSSRVVETVLREPLAPGAHGLPGDADGIRNLAVVESIGRPQYDVGPRRIGACHLAAANAPAAVRHAPRR